MISAPAPPASASASAPMLDVSAATVAFTAPGGPVVRAVDGVSFQVPAGTFVVVIGTNGSGKSTLLGAIASDALEDGRVVSGVGGQYNFVAQAFALPDARSVMTLPSWRTGGEGPESNIRWSYGHTTIPRHLRDIVVTEYGVAQLRGKTAKQRAEALIGIAHPDFRGELRDAARKMSLL